MGSLLVGWVKESMMQLISQNWVPVDEDSLGLSIWMLLYYNAALVPGGVIKVLVFKPDDSN